MRVYLIIFVSRISNQTTLPRLQLRKGRSELLEHCFTLLGIKSHDRSIMRLATFFDGRLNLSLEDLNVVLRLLIDINNLLRSSFNFGLEVFIRFGVCFLLELQNLGRL